VRERVRTKTAICVVYDRGSIAEDSHAATSSDARLTHLDDVKSGIARIYDAMSSSYNQIVPFFTYFGERLVGAAGIGEGERVLDVATGQGACVIPAAAAVGASGAVVGIDISRQMIDVLSRSIADAGLRHVRVELMDAEALTFDERSFDAVTCAFAVFHFPARMRALAEFARVLKPGGTIAFSTFANDSLGYPWFSDVVADFLPDDGVPADAVRGFVHIATDEFHDQLRAVGFESPTSEIVSAQFHFASADEHWDWIMSNGQRFMVQRVDSSRIGALKAALAQRLENHRDAQGYLFDRPTRFTLAWRAAQ
jgi:O-methyltransferase/aklanonic acid methyltransferase